MMSISLDHLLPAPDETIRCAEHARSIAVDPGGTAIRADRVVVVATPTPWPKPALAHPMLADMAMIFRGAVVPTRLLAATTEAMSGGTVIVYDRHGATASERVFDFAPPRTDLLVELAEALAVAPVGGAADTDMTVAGVRPLESYEVARPAILVCTQGTHDVCCGSEGTRLADAIEESSGGLADIRLMRVSHTGGHRFAPTAMTFPDGRMWAGIGLDEVERIASPSADLGSIVHRCRGWWGAATGVAQVGERAVLAEVGRDLDQLDRTVELLEDGNTVLVTAGDRRWRLAVETGREVPGIACRQPGGLPAKPGREYVVRSLTETTT